MIFVKSKNTDQWCLNKNSKYYHLPPLSQLPVSNLLIAYFFQKGSLTSVLPLLQDPKSEAYGLKD